MPSLRALDSYNYRLEAITDLPKDKTIWHFDILSNGA